MQKTKIDWCDYTWNPVTGCEHGCPYFYARKIATRFNGTKAWPNGFKPTFHPDRLMDPCRRRKPTRIFAVSMGDLFGEWVPEEWIDRVRLAIIGAPQHRFCVLTKAPMRMSARVVGGRWPKNVMFGATATTDAEARTGLAALRYIREAGRSTFLSIEPIREAVTTPKLADVDWIIVGCETGGAKRSIPYEENEKVARTVEAAKVAGIPVFVKENAGSGNMRRIGPCSWPKEWPEFWRQERG